MSGADLLRPDLVRPEDRARERAEARPITRTSAVADGVRREPDLAVGARPPAPGARSCFLLWASAGTTSSGGSSFFVSAAAFFAALSASFASSVGAGSCARTSALAARTASARATADARTVMEDR